MTECSHSYWQNINYRRLEELRRESQQLGIQQSARLDDITRQIADLGARIGGLKHDAQVDSCIEDDIACLQKKMSQLSVIKSDAHREISLIRSLDFDSRRTREISVPEAHSHTFHWVFSDNVGLTTSLAAGSLAWVSVKPGSGKSTLMKYLATHPKTLEALSGWSYPQSLVIVSHFFWSAGTPMQNPYRVFSKRYPVGYSSIFRILSKNLVPSDGRETQSKSDARHGT